MVLFSGNPPVRAEVNVGAEEALFGEIPVVVTASKGEQSMNRAPAVMTVVTAEDIKRMGLRTLEEVLQRVAGFYMSSSFDWQTIGSRGLINDINYHYLFLFDGHSTGSLNGWGQQNAYVIPTLSNVKQIEIVRGPGSTLWGNDAALGIINVITKTGAEQKGIKVTSDYSSGDQQEMQNVMVGGEINEDSNYLISATYFDRMGWSESHGKPNVTHPGAAATITNASAWDPWNPSWELYGKAKAGRFTFLVRDLNWSSKRADENWYGRHGNRDYANSFVEVGHELPLGDASSLETKIFADKTLKGKYPTADANPGNPGNAYVESEMYQESGVGAEALWKGRFGTAGLASLKNHELKIGARAVRTVVGPNKFMTVRASNQLILPPPLASNEPGPYDKTAAGLDVRSAVYVEDQWNVFNSVDLFGGLRLDHDSWLSYKNRKTEIVPRAGVIYYPTDAWTFKYMVDTAAVRPQTNQEFRNSKMVKNGATETPSIPYPDVEPEGITAHTLNAFYAKNGLQSSLTVFDMHIRDYTAAGGLVNGAASPSSNFGSLSTAISRGVELEIKKKMSVVEVYGNYSYAVAKLTSNAFAFKAPATAGSLFTDSHREYLGVPHQIYNLGVNWDIAPKVMWNVHLRGWKDGRGIIWNGTGTQRRSEDFKAGQDLVDTNLRFEDVFQWPLSVAVYSRNVFNVASRQMLAPSTYGYRIEEGRVIGGNVSYKF
jgi:outer membrane receptor for ferrienterochelin and colicin